MRTLSAITLSRSYLKPAVLRAGGRTLAWTENRQQAGRLIAKAQRVLLHFQ
jgi:hypothetical protein